MEMTEEIYANVDIMEYNKADSSDSENSYEHLNTQRTNQEQSGEFRLNTK